MAKALERGAACWPGLREEATGLGYGAEEGGPRWLAGWAKMEEGLDSYLNGV
jgi:hypothetical protein